MPVFLMLLGLLLLLVGGAVIVTVVVKLVTMGTLAFYAYGFVIGSAICAFLFAVTGVMMIKSGRARKHQPQPPSVVERR